MEGTSLTCHQVLRIVSHMSRRKGKKIKRKRPEDAAITQERVLSVMAQAGHPLFLREIIHYCHIKPEQKNEVRRVISDLVRRGKIVLLKGNRYGLAEQMRLVTGRLSVHPDGFGFVRPDEPGIEDVFIPPKRLKGAIHGDKVVARVERIRTKGPEGSIVRILERGLHRVIGVFRSGRKVAAVIPEDERLHFEVIIPLDAAMDARDDQIVMAEIEDFPARIRNPIGRVVEVLGDPDDLGVQTKIVMHKFDLPMDFTPETLARAKTLPDSVRPEDFRGRKDIRNLPLITIDGEHARDFDDAVHVGETRSGFVLTVAIADVSHYVQPGCPIDHEAVGRGTSVYFPNMVIPMLPEALSNNLCSLVPGEDRLAMVARIRFDRKGRVKRANFFKAVMRSHRRLTYVEARRILRQKETAIMPREEKFVQLLRSMEKLAMLLMEQRRRRGSIDFDLPEPEVILGLRGNLEDIVLRERNIAHRIIEEFMIAANEAVANFLVERLVPTLYRVHDKPAADKITEFVDFARTLGLNIKVPEEVTPKWCQKVLDMVAGKPQEYIINTVLLRTMQQAVYSPHNIGHFGLASPNYLHFTSPIRRYPDLIVHRILKGNLKRPRKRPVYTLEALEALGTALSARERVAMEAEREMLDRLKVRYMGDKIGEVYEGVISGVTSFGFFVELRQILVHGIVRLVDLADDYYVLDQARHRLMGQRTKKIFQLGQPVTVRVKSVNIARRHVNFELVDQGQGALKA